MTWRAALPPALLTGLFCCGFTLVIEAVTDVVGLAWLITLSFLSGFFGSLFSRLVLKGGAS
jgi:UPF0716 family protein affecting phage T7 exclusion